MDARSPEIEMFAPRAEAAWNILNGHYATRVSDAELDHLFARFVLGLTSPSYGDTEPSVHFDICRALVGLKLPPERVRAALHTVPEPTEPWVEGAFESVELQGTKMGQALADQKRNPTDQLFVKADAAHRELSSGAKEQVG
jgi:hypothetical protein